MGYKKPFDIKENLEAGIKYLSIQLKRFKKLDLALSAYNAGPGRVKDMNSPQNWRNRSVCQKIIEIYSKIRPDYLEYNPSLR